MTKRSSDSKRRPKNFSALDDSETRGDLLAYTLGARQLDGCCTCQDERYERGRAVLTRLAINGDESPPAATQCADMLFFVSSSKLPSGDNAADAGLRSALYIAEHVLRNLQPLA